MPRNFGMGYCHDRAGKLVYAERIAAPGPGVAAPLTCAMCGTQVEARNGYVNYRGTQVRAYFALKAGHRHSESCDFNYDRRASDIVERHEEVTRERGHYVLLLRTPETEEGSTNTNTPAEAGRPKVTIVSTNEHGGVHPSLQAARSIVRLLATFDNHPELVEDWRASYQGQQIAWPNFHYHAETQNADLANDLANASLNHPRAVQGVVRQAGVSPDGSRYFVDLASGPSKRDGRFVNIRLGANAKSPLLRNLNVGDNIMAYGLWSEPWRATTEATRESVTLWVNTASAVTRII